MNASNFVGNTSYVWESSQDESAQDRAGRKVTVYFVIVIFFLYAFGFILARRKDLKDLKMVSTVCLLEFVRVSSQ